MIIVGFILLQMGRVRVEIIGDVWIDWWFLEFIICILLFIVFLIIQLCLVFINIYYSICKFIIVCNSIFL